MPILTALDLLRRSNEQVSTLQAVKYLLRAALSPRSHLQWNRYLLGDATGQARALAQPHLLWKLQRSYLSRGVKIRHKLDWLRQHHDWVARHWPAEPVSRLYLDGQLALAEIVLDDSGTRLQFELSMDQQFAKEGELVIKLWRQARDDGARERVAALAFAIHRHLGHWVAHIGCLQGTSGAQGADVVRTATREMHGLRPKQAVMIALYALTSAQGVDHVRAVANADHVYQGHWRRRERVVADYDTYWAELGGQPDDSAWRLPTRIGRKAVADIASKKRAQYRRRHALEDELVAQIRRVLPPAGRESDDSDAPVSVFGPGQPHATDGAD
ncbi:MAG: hypothetical protein RIQ60_3976 [Pseudomonadota bacterium]